MNPIFCLLLTIAGLCIMITQNLWLGIGVALFVLGLELADL